MLDFACTRPPTAVSFEEWKSFTEEACFSLKKPSAPSLSIPKPLASNWIGIIKRTVDEQAAALRRHLREKGIQAADFHWGQPTLVLRDLDQNELFFWLPQGERESLAAKQQPIS